MAVVKLVKNSVYFKRLQTKFRRRRTGQTDYYARKRLIHQDKNKYNTPKYRLVVRFTNKQVICQIISAKIIGDEVLSTASSSELQRYGLKVGLTNYSAAYCTGYLLARRTLTKLNMGDMYKGVEEITGGDVDIEENDDRRPFTAYLDVGLKRTTTGANIFGALKGAVDGGLNVPHKNTRFPGSKQGKADDAVHRDRIFGQHIADYMRQVMDTDESLYNSKFGGYIKAGVNADNYEETIQNCIEKIKADPALPERKTGPYTGKKYVLRKKMNLKQRKNRVNQIKESLLASLRKENDA